VARTPHVAFINPTRTRRARIPHSPVAHRRWHRSPLGMGLMEGKQKLFYLPEPQTDSSSPWWPKNGPDRRGSLRCGVRLLLLRGLRAHGIRAITCAMLAWRTAISVFRHFSTSVCARAAASQRDSAAVHLLWRIVAHCHPSCVACCSTSRSRRTDNEDHSAGGGTGGHLSRHLRLRKLRRRGHDAAFVGTSVALKHDWFPKPTSLYL